MKLESFQSYMDYTLMAMIEEMTGERKWPGIKLKEKTVEEKIATERVHYYNLKNDEGDQTVEMHYGAKILGVSDRGGEAVIIVAEDTSFDLENRKFKVQLNTVFKDDRKVSYVGVAKMNNTVPVVIFEVLSLV